MNSLDCKLFRDLWRSRAQAFGICIVLAVATWTYVMANGSHYSLSETRRAYYEQSNFADVFASMTRAPRSIVSRVAEINGVQRVQGKIRQYATLDFPERSEPIRAMITSIDEYGRDRLNLLTLNQGRSPRPGQSKEVIVDEAFAEANNLGLGDRIDAIIHGNRETLEIVGLGLSPEYIFAVAPGDLLPDRERFGIMWMGTKALEAATERKEAINYISLRLEHGASEPEVIRELDLLLEGYGGSGAHGRADHLSHAFLNNELSQLESLSAIIPPVFLLVSAFLVFVVMSRMVQSERALIGLLKAIGYSDWAIAAHYLKFALVIAGIGAVIGSIAGILIGQDITSFYADSYRFPFLEYKLPLDVFITASVLSLAAATLGALGGVRAAVTLPPAVAMAPPPPPAYRSGPVEELGRKAALSPIGNMIVRHIVRWPMRSVMTVFGVALSIALLFSTQQFVDSARVMIDSSFARAQRQDLAVLFVEASNEDVIYELEQIPGVLRAEPERTQFVKLRAGHREERALITSVPVDSQLSVRIHRDRSAIPLPDDGIMFSKYLADKLHLAIGDAVEVEMLGGRRNKLFLEVTGMVDEFFGERAYASSKTFDRLARDASPATSANLLIDDDARDEILSRFKEMPAVLGITERDTSLVKFEELIDDNILTMLNIFTAFAAAVTAGVVYNSARIILAERVQELATLRVLGYRRHEVATVLLGELGLLVALAVPVGCIIGNILARYMTTLFVSDLFRLPFAPAHETYAYAILACLAAAVLSALIVGRRVMQLDTVHELQARE